jgi:hypothetical protein
MVAAMYVVGGEGDREDLRYSLRSLNANAMAIDEVWIVGDVPSWAAAARMPYPPLFSKFPNQRQSIERFVNAPGAPEQFYLFNDDMFVIELVDGPLPVCHNRHPASKWAADERKRRSLNSWHRAVIATAEWTAERLGTDPWIYECHTPLLFDTATLRDLLDEYPADRPFAAGELYPLAGIGGEGTFCGNAKCGRDDKLAAKLASPMPYLSASPDTWDGELGDYIRELFPNQCFWERSAA